MTRQRPDFILPSRKLLPIAAVFFLCANFAANAQQVITLAPSSGVGPAEIYSGTNYTGYHTNGFTVSSSGGTDTIDFDVTGLPSGASLVPINSFVPGTTANYLFAIQVANVAAGDYTLTLTASSTNESIAVKTKTFGLHVGNRVFWVATNPATTNWSTTANWSPAFATGDNVCFEDQPVEIGGTNRVTANTTVGHLSYLRSANGKQWATILNSGITLTVTNGFSANSISGDNGGGNSHTWGLFMSGSGGATLLVTNTSKDFSLNQVNSAAAATTYLFSFSGLPNLKAYVNRFGVADVSLISEGTVGAQAFKCDFSPTTFIVANYVGNYDQEVFNTSISFWNHGDSAYVNGNAQSFSNSLGSSTTFWADSFDLGGGRVSSSANNMRPRSGSSTAQFRNVDGVSRMTMMGVAVDSGTNTISSGCRATLNFAGSSLDVLADKLWLGRCRPRQGGNANAHVYGTLNFGGGTVDVNTAILGYQVYTNDNDCQGTVNVTNGTFIVNNELVLGYSYGDFVTNGSFAVNGFGKLNVSGSSGRARINTLTVGGPGKVSVANNVTVSGSGGIFLTNTAGASDAKINQLIVSSASLTLHVNGLDPKIYTKDVTATSATINIASLTNVGNYPIQVPLISYETESGAANFTLGTLPSASPSYQGYIVNNGGNSTVDLILTNGPAQQGPRTWTGSTSTNWDTTTTNWLNFGSAAVYNDGLVARFDDSSTVSNVTLTTTFSPFSTIVSNNSVTYAFTGAGNLSGGGTLIKQNTGTLVIANTVANDLTGATTISGGTLQVGNGGTSGNLGSGDIADNATLVFNRSDALAVANMISGTGSVTKNGAGTTSLSASNSFTGNTTINTGALALTGSGNISSSANIFIAAGASLDVSGRADGTLTLASGQTLKGNGSVLGNLTASLDSTVSPGASVGSLTVTNAIVLQGTTVMEIDKTAGTNDVLRSTATLTYGGTLILSNLSAAYAGGDSFKLFDAASYSGSFTNIIPAAPGVGLLWDTGDLTGSGSLKVIVDVPLLTWTGAASGDWDTAATNWLNFGEPTNYSNGLRVRFDDSASIASVNLTTALSPLSVTVSNGSLAYAFTGTGKISGGSALTKQGSATLTIANTGVNDFTGGTSIGGGTLQIGTGGANGSLGGNGVANSAALVFNRTGSLTISNNISGGGTLTKNASGTISLAGTNTFTGNTTINTGTLALLGSGTISGSALITVASGATLDASARSDGTLTLASGQTLQGNGTVIGNLTANFGSTVSPGQSVGVLAVSNAIVLNGTTKVEIDKTAGTNDLLRGGSIAFGGTLAVSNLSAAFADGDSFKIFDATNYFGAFTNITPKRPATGLAWDTSALIDSGSLKVTLAPPVIPSASIKVDFSLPGRPEAIDPTFSSWVFDGGATVTNTFSGITLIFTRVGPYGASLTADWWKAGVDDFNCLMADDGITVNSGDLGGQIEMRIRGLSAGAHTVATYHNSWQDPAGNTFSPMDISLNGTPIVTNFISSNRVTNNYDSASAYMQVTALEDEDLVFLFAAQTNNAATDKNVWIAGIEIDTVNSTTKALNPYPADRDEHVDAGTNKSVLMYWSAAASAVSNDVYFGTSSNAVATATHASAEFKGSQVATNFTATNLSTLATYYWRVDEINSTNGVAKGDVWYFRTRHLAFPGAEGYGRFARGGRSGIVVEVTNTNDSGAGSFREAISSTLTGSGPRTIVFTVSGLITLQSDLTVNKFNSKLTIAGQTAPGKGVNFAKYPFGFSGGEDVIVRHIRVYPGKGSGGTVNGMGVGGVDHAIMDHCSSGWSMDECIPSRGAQNMTIQKVLIAEPLNVAGHKNYPPGTRHGYSTSTSGDIGSWHHNLLAHADGRNWSLAGGLDGNGVYAGRLDIRCNVVYNWNGRTTDGGVKELNFVNNYYKKGPVGGITTYLNPDHGTNSDGSYGQRYYSSGNTMPGYPQSNSGGWMTNQAFFDSYVTTQSATNAYKIVVSDVGASQPVIDDHDARVLNETRNGTYTYNGSVSGLNGLPDSENDVGAWENYGSTVRPADWDTDHDGLPNWWEIIKGLNTNSAPNDFSDSNVDLVGDEYTELDRYLNWMAVPHYDCTNGIPFDIDLSQFTRGFTNAAVHVASNPTNGTVTILGDNKTARFTASADGLAGFEFRVVDAVGDTMTNSIGLRSLANGNHAPALAVISNRTVNVGVTVNFTNSASDSDFPAQNLTFSLASGPTNATVGTSSGIFSWRPLVTHANSTNAFSVVVADDGTPNLTATQSFNVTVNALPLPGIALSGQSENQFNLTVSGQTGPDYAVQTSSNLVDWSTLFTTNPPAMPFIFMGTNAGDFPSAHFFRIKVGPPLP